MVALSRNGLPIAKLTRAIRDRYGSPGEVGSIQCRVSPEMKPFRMKRRVKVRTDSYQAPALEKGLEALEFLAGQAEPYAVSELARTLGKSRNESTAW